MVYLENLACFGEKAEEIATKNINNAFKTSLEYLSDMYLQKESGEYEEQVLSEEIFPTWFTGDKFDFVRKLFTKVESNEFQEFDDLELLVICNALEFFYAGYCNAEYSLGNALQLIRELAEPFDLPPFLEESYHIFPISNPYDRMLLMESIAKLCDDEGNCDCFHSLLEYYMGVIEDAKNYPELLSQDLDFLLLGKLTLEEILNIEKDNPELGVCFNIKEEYYK